MRPVAAAAVDQQQPGKINGAVLQKRSECVCVTDLFSYSDFQEQRYCLENAETQEDYGEQHASRLADLVCTESSGFAYKKVWSFGLLQLVSRI